MPIFMLNNIPLCTSNAFALSCQTSELLSAWNYMNKAFYKVCLVWVLEIRVSFLEQYPKLKVFSFYISVLLFHAFCGRIKVAPFFPSSIYLKHHTSIWYNCVCVILGTVEFGFFTLLCAPPLRCFRFHFLTTQSINYSF